MKFFLSLLLVGLLSYGLQAQNCDCDHVLDNLSTTDVNIIHASSFDYAPGDVFCVRGGQMAGLRFLGFKGAPGEPLTFTNCEGAVVINETPHAGITFIESEYIHLTGTGDSNVQYGFHVAQSGAGQVGLNVTAFSTDIEIDHVEIENTGFAGIMAKTDPRCENPTTWRSSGFVLRNLDIHHNYIHHTTGEGIYIGYSGGYKVESNVSCGGQKRFGHWLENVEVHHNLIENVGWDGIQLNLVRSNGKVHNNTILNWATASEFYQDFVLNVTGGTYEVYNNYMRSSGGNVGKGIQVISAQSGSKFYNNMLVNPESHGMFIHARHEFDDPAEGYYIVNNTIIRPGRSGFFYDAQIMHSADQNLVGFRQNEASMYFVNNLVVSPGSNYGVDPTWKLEPESYFDFNTPDTRDAHLFTIYGNFTTRRIDTLGLENPAQDRYAPANSNSVLVDRGSSALPFNLNFDLENDSRAVNGAYDIGAYEFQGISTSSGYAPEESPFSVFPNPAPADNPVYMDLPADDTEVRIVAANGQVQYQAIHDGGQQHLPINRLVAGVYWVQVRRGDVSGAQLLIVQ
ncbi:MAG: T9SS type A sorting domain-containing protein [Bacteroidota bacterium]